jgi:hypothetical protein
MENSEFAKQQFFKHIIIVNAKLVEPVSIFNFNLEVSI